MRTYVHSTHARTPTAAEIQADLQGRATSQHTTKYVRAVRTPTHANARAHARAHTQTHTHTQERRAEGRVPVQVGPTTEAYCPAEHATVDEPDHPLVEQVKVQSLPLLTDDEEQELV